MPFAIKSRATSIVRGEVSASRIVVISELTRVWSIVGGVEGAVSRISMFSVMLCIPPLLSSASIVIVQVVEVGLAGMVIVRVLSDIEMAEFVVQVDSVVLCVYVKVSPSSSVK